MILFCSNRKSSTSCFPSRVPVFTSARRSFSIPLAVFITVEFRRPDQDLPVGPAAEANHVAVGRFKRVSVHLDGVVHFEGLTLPRWKEEGDQSLQDEKVTRSGRGTSGKTETVTDENLHPRAHLHRQEACRPSPRPGSSGRG